MFILIQYKPYFKLSLNRTYILSECLVVNEMLHDIDLSMVYSFCLNFLDIVII
jgi:hypothetical protein